MSHITVDENRFNALEEEVSEISERLKPIESALPMLVESHRKQTEILEKLAGQSEVISGLKRDSDKADAKLEKQSEIITTLRIDTKINAVKIAGAVSVTTVIVGLAIKSMIGG